LVVGGEALVRGKVERDGVVNSDCEGVWVELIKLVATDLILRVHVLHNRRTKSSKTTGSNHELFQLHVIANLGSLQKIIM